MFLESRLAPQDSITAAELEDGLKWLVRNGVAGKMMDTLAVGAFLTAFALQLGASYLFIGVLASIPHLGNIGQVIGVYLIERVRRRKAICVGLGFLVRPMLAVVAAAALIPQTSVALGLVMAALIVRYLFGSVILCSWNSWIRDLVPEDQRADFLARRLRGMTFFAMLASLAAAGFVDAWQRFDLGPKQYGYSVTFLLAFAFGVYNTYALSHVPEPRMPAPEERPKLWDIYRTPFRDENFRRLILFLGSWNFAINLAAPFFTVHMLKRLELDLLWVILFAVISQLANVAVVRTWGRIAQRFSNKSVLAVCAPLFVVCIFGWIFTTAPNRYELTIPLLVLIHILTGISSAGVSLASSNLAMKLAPAGEATAYLSTNSIVNSVSAGLAPVLGGLLADLVVNQRFSVTLNWASSDIVYAFETLRLEQWDFFFAIATLLGLYSIHRLTMVVEEGEASERAVLEELLHSAKGGLRTLSSIAGLQHLTEFPSGLEDRRGDRRRPDDPESPAPPAAR